MNIKIDDVEYELHFGWDFIEYLNDKNGVVVEGLKMDTGGLTKLTGQLDLGDPIALRLAIQAGTNTLRSKPSKRGIEKYIEGLIESGEYESFLQELQEKLEKNPLTRVVIQREDGLAGISE